MFSSIFATLFTAIKWVCGWWGQMLFGTYNGVKLTVPFSGFGNYGLTAKKSSLFSSFEEDDWRNDNAVDSGGDQCVTKPKIWTKSNPKLFSDTNFFRYRIRYFFRNREVSKLKCHTLVVMVMIIVTAKIIFVFFRYFKSCMCNIFSSVFAEVEQILF